MDQFFPVQDTRFYADMLGVNDAGAASSQAGQAGKDGVSVFAAAVQDKLDESGQKMAGGEEYRGESNSMGFQNNKKRMNSAKKKKEKSFWEKRAERHKLYMDLAQKAWYKRENERRFQEKVAFGRKEVSSALLKQQSVERATGEQVELGVNPSVLSKAATECAQEYVFFKIPSALINPRPKTGK